MGWHKASLPCYLLCLHVVAGVLLDTGRVVDLPAGLAFVRAVEPAGEF
jgi:hypothetical protein